MQNKNCLFSTILDLRRKVLRTRAKFVGMYVPFICLRKINVFFTYEIGHEFISWSYTFSVLKKTSSFLGKA